MGPTLISDLVVRNIGHVGLYPLSGTGRGTTGWLPHAALEFIDLPCYPKSRALQAQRVGLARRRRVPQGRAWVHEFDVNLARELECPSSLPGLLGPVVPLSHASLLKRAIVSSGITASWSF